VDATTHTEQSELFAVAKRADPTHSVSLRVVWTWEHDTDRYWFTHECYDVTNRMRLCHASNGFRWKASDAVGDAGLVVRYIREARSHLILPT